MPKIPRSYLLTGGTGYLGRAIIATLLSRAHRDTRICIYSRGEHAQAAVRAAFANDGRLRWLIGDVRDRERLRWACEGVDVLIHCAALKRIEVGEYNPAEMVATNVGGAQNVIEAARGAGVLRVVGISSDKACAPLNCYGATKLTAEKLLLGANVPGRGPVFSVVRYGNVAGSTGSVVPLWRAMRGGALVTDLNCTRYYIDAREAVDLVLWASEHAERGWLVVPDLPAYRLGDLAVALGVQVGKAVGLGAGEKRHEQMIDPNEAGQFAPVGGEVGTRYWVRGVLPPPGGEPLGPCPTSSDRARRMSVDELRERLAAVE